MSEIIAVATAAGMTHAAIQADRGQLPVGSITSLKALHGDKWRAALDETYRLVESIEFDRVSAALERYAQAHRAAFEAVLKS